MKAWLSWLRASSAGYSLLQLPATIALLHVASSCAPLKADHKPRGGEAGTEPCESCGGAPGGSGGSAAGATSSGVGDGGSSGRGASSAGNGPDESGGTRGESGACSGCGGGSGDSGAAGSSSVECSDGCEPLTFKCGEENRVLFCEPKSEACAEWIEVRTCSAGQICCNAACIEVGDANCYGCGNECADLTPACDHEIHACGCSRESCARLGTVCDKATRACTYPSEFYVSAERSGTGSGVTPDDPFRTITEALQAISPLPEVPMRVHIGPGIYDEGLGERFPLRIPVYVSLEGAGSDKTLISGVGPASGQFNENCFATMIVGDSFWQQFQDDVTRIANVALRPGPVHPNPSYGIFCAGGSAPLLGDAYPPPSTLLHGLHISGAYEGAVRVTHSALRDSGGCNLALTSSRISDAAYGITSEGCYEAPHWQQVAIQVGDGTAEGGNEFWNIKTWGKTLGAGVFASGCTRISASYNHFHDSNMGIRMQGLAARAPGTDRAVIEHNAFEDLDHAGVHLTGGRVVVDNLSHNRFERIITKTHVTPPLAAGLAILSPNDSEPFPRVFARNNSFRLSDVGVLIQGESPLTPDRASDFGTSMDEGWNIFSCNSTRADAPIAGGDVRLDVPDADGMTFLFSGNEWDHVPPTRIQTSAPMTGNGTDIAASSTNQLQLDTHAVFLAEEACTEGWIP